MNDVHTRRRIRVVIADDEAMVRDSLSMLLDSEPDIEVVAGASNGSNAVELTSRLQPDVVVLDVRMPVMDGVEATRAIVADEFSSGGHTIKVLILSSYNDDAAVYGALRCGASGFLLKSAASMDLALAVRSVAAGKAWLDPTVARTLISEFASRPDPDLPSPGELAALTDREREVLVLIAHGLGTGAIADHLMITAATAKTHIGRILMKLGLRDRSQAVVAAYKSGLVHPGDAPPSSLHPRR